MIQCACVRHAPGTVSPLLEAQTSLRLTSNEGAKCGGTTIDRALHQLMTYKYGEAFSGKDITEISHGSQFMK